MSTQNQNDQQLADRIEALVRDVPDYPTPGVVFKDITPLLADAAAFDATMKDKDYLADAKKSRIDVNPVSGADIQKLLAELYATPKDVIKKASQAIAR